MTQISQTARIRLEIFTVKYQALKLIFEDWLTEKKKMESVNFATRLCKEMNICAGKKNS